MSTPAAAVAPRTAAALRRRAPGSAARSSTADEPAGRPASRLPAGMFSIYTDDSPGIKVDPVIVLVGTLTFVASVFLLHIVSKWTRH